MSRTTETNADLAAAPRQAVIDLAERLAAGRRVEQLQIPQQGLWLLRLQEPVRGDRFFLGEVPVGTACVALHDPQLGTTRGGSALLGGDAEFAVAAAVCDAVVAAGWPGSDEATALAATGAAVRAGESRVRQAILERTRVDFSELGQEEA